jgi:hypothetical protein
LINLELKNPIDSKDLITFLEANHNLMIFADAEAKRPVRQLVNEFGIEFEAPVSDLIMVVYRDFTNIIYRVLK